MRLVGALERERGGVASRAPSKPHGFPPPQPGARGLVAPQNIPQRKLCGPSPQRGARQRPVGVPSSRTSRRQTPTSAQARRRAGNGEERGRTPAPATPPRSRGAGVRPRSFPVPGPSACLRAGGRLAPRGSVMTEPPRAAGGRHAEGWARKAYAVGFSGGRRDRGPLAEAWGKPCGLWGL